MLCWRHNIQHGTTLGTEWRGNVVYQRALKWRCHDDVSTTAQSNWPCDLQFWRSFFFFFCQNTAVHCGSWLPIKSSLFPTIVYNSLLVFYSRHIYIFFILISPSLTWSSTFACSFHCSYWNLFWHALVLHSFNVTIPSYSEGFYKPYSIFPF